MTKIHLDEIERKAHSVFSADPHIDSALLALVRAVRAAQRMVAASKRVVSDYSAAADLEFNAADIALNEALAPFRKESGK